TTDLLIALSKSVEGNSYDEEALARVVNRYAEIVRDLSLSESLIDSIEDNLKQTISKLHNNENRLLDALKASGENNNAKLLAAYLQSSEHEVSYVSLKKERLMRTYEIGDANVLPQNSEQLASLKERRGKLVIPEFFGYSHEANIVT